jgi:hypothetical protein
MNNSYTVYYRTGGCDNFKWQKAFPVATQTEAIKQREEILRKGYMAHYAKTELLDSIGLPDTYGGDCLSM